MSSFGRLRADPAVAATNVVFFTAHFHEREARNLADACGVCHVLTKPCEPELVLQTVDAALGVAHAVAPAAMTEQFDREHLRLLTDKLTQKAEDLRRANARLTALVDLGLEFGSNRDLRHVLQSFCHSAREIIGARYAIAGILAGGDLRLRYFFTSGMDAATADRVGSPDPRRGGIQTVLRESRCLRLCNPGGSTTAIDFPSSYPAIHSWLGAPIVSPGRVYGWLGLLNKIGADAFSDEDERVAGILAAQVGRIYENGSLYADVLRHANELETEVAERKRAEQSLRESEAQFRHAQQRLEQVVTSSPAVLFTLAIAGDQIQGISWISPNLLEILGHAPEVALGQDWWLAHIHPEDRDRIVSQTNADVFSLGRASHEYRFRHGNGSYRWTRCELLLVREGAGQPLEVVGSWSDITERKQLEEQFRQAQKMEAVGRLAGRRGSRLQQPADRHQRLRRAGPGQAARPATRSATCSGRWSRPASRAAGLTRQLLAFSRKAILEPRVLDLKAVVADVDKMLRRLIGEDIQLAVVADPDLGAVKADPGQIEQVIMNLVVNARDAMPQGGRLTIETAQRRTGRDLCPGRTPRSGPARMCCWPSPTPAAAWTGRRLSRIFEPFFTTKGEKGTGLGLATVHGIVKQSGGHVAVYSEVGHGTTFKMYLPRVAAARRRGQVPPRVRRRCRAAARRCCWWRTRTGCAPWPATSCSECGYTVLEARRRRRGPADRGTASGAASTCW